LNPVFGDRARVIVPRSSPPDGWGDITSRPRRASTLTSPASPRGDYDLVHRLKDRHLLREANYANAASSLRIRLLPPATPTDLPGVLVLETCETGTRC
jgi:hypothetical protein